jgi:predicted ATPase/class 3 adenylate cyclase
MSARPQEDAAVIPSGTITFVFTDIEGSTQRWDRDRAAMAAAVRRHDALMRETIAAHNGHVFKTIGDAFCAAFSRPGDAIAAMFDAQRTLGAEDFSAVGGLRVRVAIHTGTADERDRDYFGPAVNRVARLLGIGHGGQVLLSGVTSDLVEGALPPQASLRDLGEQRLKDLARPEHVYQLLAPALIDDFPPLRSLNAMPNNLPSVATSFIGREDEVAEITALLAKYRVVTLVGSGGVGKTRTSLQVAANLLDGSGDGVWFIELGPLSRGDLIPSAIASALRLTLPAEGDQIEHLVRALHEKRALLVFDNCEHLVDASAKVIASIVRGCAHIVVLASSRQGLGIAGEATYRMPPLTTPRDPGGALLSAADAPRYAAIELFVERARASDYRFTLTDENAPIVADICRRLDGIALAIELAAARVKVLSVRQLDDRLDERFRILTGGSRDALPRQQTLRALIDWSYDLLDDRERTLFRRLGIFRDGFTLEGAAAVASGERIEELDVFDLLASLVDKSLVLAEPTGDDVRYRLLESTRAYASERLLEAGERDLLAGRHLRYFRDRFTGTYERQEATGRNTEMNAAFATELEGVRFSLDEALAQADIVVGAELLAAIKRTWLPLGLLREGIDRNEAFIAALPIGELLLLAKLSATLGSLLLDQGSVSRSLDALTRARADARRSADGPTRAFALAWHARANVDLGKLAEAEEALIEADTLSSLPARRRSSLIDSRIRLNLGNGDLDAVARAYEERIAESRALGNARDVHVNVANLALVEKRRGHAARAIALVREVLPAVRSGDDQRLCALLLATLTGHLLDSNDLPGAKESAREAIGLLKSEPGQILVACLLEDLALLDALEGRFERAAQLAAYADAAITKVGYRRAPGDRENREKLTRLLDDNLNPQDGARLAREGAALTAKAAIALPLDEAVRAP